MSEGDDAVLESLLEYLKRTRGFDFTGYKRASLRRRIDKRLGELGVAIQDYQDYLEVHQEEFGQLFNTILINVTSFLRDEPPWEYLSSEALPRILGAKDGFEPVRVWSAGCASGEEAYTLAVLLADAVGEEAFRERVKVFATDVDEDALTLARHGSYTAKDLSPLAPEQRSRYFEQAGSRFVFRNDLRQSIIFGRHDLVQDAPISRLDLLVCRNVLMYFNLETQERIVNHLHFALKDGGILFLGKAEMLLTMTRLFEPVDLRFRVFRKLPVTGEGRDRLLPVAVPAVAELPRDRVTRLRAAVMDASPAAQVLVDETDTLAAVNEQGQMLFGITARDLGRPIQDLEISYRPMELRSRIEEAYTARRPVHVPNVERVSRTGDVRYMDVIVAPLFDTDGSRLGIAVTFNDITRMHRLQEELQHSHQELETAYEEMQSTNEELETTNEELQSTVEELETTNEELQSTNEELETMNEELQSTNAELQAVNDELRTRTEETGRLTSFLESIVESMQMAVVVVARSLAVEVWNRQAEDLWGLRAEEVIGQPFLSLDIGLPVAELSAPIRACLEVSREEGLELDATNRRGKSIRCRVVCSPLYFSDGARSGVILAMQEVPAG